MGKREQRDAAPVVSSDRFERLFRGHYAAVLGYARRRAEADEVDDVVVETFLVAWRRLEHVPAEELPWLLGVAPNVLARTLGAGVAATRWDFAWRLPAGSWPWWGLAISPVAGPRLRLRGLRRVIARRCC